VTPKSLKKTLLILHALNIKHL